MLCYPPKISVSYHHAVVGELTRRADEATRENQLTLAEMKSMTASLKEMTHSMAVQTEVINEYIKKVAEKEEEIKLLNERLEALNPDTTIYEDDMSEGESVSSAEEKNAEEFEEFNANCMGMVVFTAMLIILYSKFNAFSYDLD